MREMFPSPFSLNQSVLTHHQANNYLSKLDLFPSTQNSKVIRMEFSTASEFFNLSTFAGLFLVNHDHWITENYSLSLHYISNLEYSRL